MTTRWRFPAALLLIGSLLLSACGGGNGIPATGGAVQTSRQALDQACQEIDAALAAVQ